MNAERTALSANAVGRECRSALDGAVVVDALGLAAQSQPGTSRVQCHWVSISSDIADEPGGGLHPEMLIETNKLHVMTRVPRSLIK